MSDILRRMFGEARPIDDLILIVDFLVLVAILWFEGPEYLRKRRVNRRVKRLVKVMSAGRDLLKMRPKELGSSFPEEIEDESSLVAWQERVRLWLMDARQFLGTYSSPASVTLTDDLPPLQYATQAASYWSALEWNTMLTDLLNKLHDIMEKSDVYF